MKTRMIALLCALVMGFAVLSGCSNGNAPTASGNAAQEAPTTAPDTAPDTQAAPAPVSAEDEKYGGTLYFGYPYDLTRPNFILTGDGPGNFVRELTWDTLFVVNEKSELIPRLAEKYELSSDGLTYDVKLRPGVTWHDGTPFTANDIVFFFDYYPRIDSVDLSYDFSNFKAEKVDDLTVKFTLSELDATFAYTTLAEISFIPEHIWKDIDPTIWDEISDLSKLVGIGPFKLVERVESEYLRFERFDEYWDQKPYLESVVLQLIPDATALALAFESKQVQLAQVNYENTFQVLEGAEGFKFYFKPSANLGIFMVNHNDPLLSQLPIRKAVSFLIDRQSLILAQKNGAAALDSAFTPVDQYYNPSVADPEAFEYSQEKAAAILDQEGWVLGADGIREKDGEKLKLEVLTYAANDRNAVIMQDSFKKAGIDLTYTSVETAVFSDLVYSKGEYQLAGNGSGPSVGPVSANYEVVFTLSPYYNYDNPVVAQAFKDAKGTVDTEKQRENYELIQKTLTEDRAQIFTWNMPRIWGTNSGLNVDGAGFSGIYPPWVDFSKVYFEK